MVGVEVLRRLGLGVGVGVGRKRWFLTGSRTWNSGAPEKPRSPVVQEDRVKTDPTQQVECRIYGSQKKYRSMWCIDYGGRPFWKSSHPQYGAMSGSVGTTRS